MTARFWRVLPGPQPDAFTLFELFEAKLKELRGNMVRAAVEMTKEWRKDKYLRKLEAMLLLADSEHILVLSGTGDVIEPDDEVAAIGSGGPYALAAARGACPAQRHGCGGHCPRGHAHCLGNLRVHQRQPYG